MGSDGEDEAGTGPPQTFVAKLLNKADEQIMRMIEKDDGFEGLREKKAGKTWLFMTFFCGKLAFAAAFVYFAYTGYYADQKLRFIALDKEAGVCKEIPLALSGRYFLDDFGSWSGSAAYEAGKARYVIELNGFQHSDDEYASFITDVRNVIFGISSNATNYNLAVNLVYWAFWGYKYLDGSQVHYVRLSGDPRNIFDRFYKNGGYGDVSGDCAVGSSVLWDVNSGMMGLQLSYGAVTSNAICMSATDPASLGYNAEINGDEFIFRFDTRALMLAFAINLDITPTDLLDNVFDSKFDGKIIGCSTTMTPECADDKYQFFLGSDPDQPGMQPVYCLKPFQRRSGYSYNFNNLCAIRIADQYVFPFMQHFGISGVDGNNPYVAKKCDCSSADGKNAYCDDFDMMIGFAFFEAAALAGNVTVNFQYLLDLVYKNDRFALNEMMYEAAFAVQRLGGEGSVYPPDRPSGVSWTDYTKARNLMNTTAWRRDTYSFCNQNCAVFSFRLYDAFNRFVNPDNFELESGGCEDTFYTDDTPFNIAANTPPVPLIQDYMGACRLVAASPTDWTGVHPLTFPLPLPLPLFLPECVTTQTASIISSLGVAMGIAAPITAGFVMLVIFVVGKVWERLTAKKEQDLAVARASLIIGDEDEQGMDQSSTSKSKKNAPHSKAAIKLALARSSMLGESSNSELDSILSFKKTKKIALNAFVYRPKDPDSESFFYIKAGSFKIVDCLSGIETIKYEGQIFGDTDCFSKKDRSESAQCVSVGSDGKAVLVVFPRSALLYIMSKRQGFAISDSEDDSDSDSEGDRRGRGRGRGNENSAAADAAAAGSSIVQFDDIFCVARRR